MPPVGAKGKSKAQTTRRSRSRNTTPGSVTAPTGAAATTPGTTAFLDLPLSQLLVPSNITYDEILDRHGAATAIPDTKHLESLAADLRALAQQAEMRGQVCDKGMRDLSKKRKERVEEDREKEREDREADERHEKLKREAAQVEDDEGPGAGAGAGAAGRRGVKPRKGKDGSRVREERPLTHGAHGLARQDGVDTEMKGISPHLIIYTAVMPDDGKKKGELDILNENLVLDIPRRSDQIRPTLPWPDGGNKKGELDILNENLVLDIPRRFNQIRPTLRLPHLPLQSSVLPDYGEKKGELDILNENLVLDTPRRSNQIRHVDYSSSPEQRKAQRKGAASPGRIKRETASTSISSLSPSSHAPSPAAATATATATAAEDAHSEASSPSSGSSLSDHQPPPAPAVPHYQTFGPDPATFDDPTIYHIREVTPGMSEDEIKEIYAVTQYPHDDLQDLIPGTPPDKDFSNAKPTNQVTANAFATYIEPYFRAFTEEDLAFLRERGDRTQPFVIPRRGKKHYTEIWAEEDGAMSIDSAQGSSSGSRLPPNQPRGSIEQMNDDIAESDEISSGPLLSRLLSIMRPEHRPDPAEDKSAANGIAGGDASMAGLNLDFGNELDPLGELEKMGPLPPATFIPDSTQQGWKVPTTKLDYAQVDERLKQELRYIGFLEEGVEPDYDAHYDDEIAARLRHLQSELKEQSILNGARKARIAELAKTRLAHQEYTTILDDLDNQVQQAYLRRTKTLGKGKKQQKRPGGAGGGSHYSGPGGTGVTRPGIGDLVKTLMERRKKWVDSIGPVFEDRLGRVPSETIFDESVMAGLLEREREGWDEGEE
ncbi:MAG: hypothetical protein M1825_000503 [Sarcosagium campestre]|nr:MAG: hypothetical protein M1825_000503 [Sarcosagium campestre]